MRDSLVGRRAFPTNSPSGEVHFDLSFDVTAANVRLCGFSTDAGSIPAESLQNKALADISKNESRRGS
jgi:hypothetical protein